jgi:hypothetical protein
MNIKRMQPTVDGPTPHFHTGGSRQLAGGKT